MEESPLGVTHQSPSHVKIALFRSLFRGREDLYVRRFESRRTGKVGYLPACRNEWIRGICEKPKTKCIECRYRCFFPVTDDVIRRHLSGQNDHGKEFVVGIYPMLLDDRCFFLAVHFDTSHWEKDARAFLKTCQELDVPAAMERSHSGAFGWIFFSEAIPAVLARKLACHILTETMESYADIGLDSYDRLFPSQDTLPQGGFGSPIVLPLQKKARECGNSVFVDEEFIAHEDQWAYLSALRKARREEVEALVRRAETRGRIIGTHFRMEKEDEGYPWSMSKGVDLPLPTDDLPKNLELILGNEVYVPKISLPSALKNRLIRLAAFPNF